MKNIENLSFGRSRPDDLRRIHEQLDGLVADRDQMDRLLKVAIEISSDPELNATLQRVIDTAMTMTGARFGAIAVWAAEGDLQTFVHAGIGNPQVHQIGRLPVGKGVLGLMRDQRGPLRLDDLTEDPDAVGFPEHHPMMRAFLGMPITVRGEAFGALYVADDRLERTFTEPDELTVRALASVASVAIDNARLFDQTRATARWIAASREITAALLSDPGSELDAIELIASQARELTDAEQCIVLVPETPGEPADDVSTLVVSTAVGRYADEVLGQRLPVDSSTTGAVFRSGQPLITERFRRPIHAFTDVGDRQAIVVPLRADQQVLGVLAVARNGSQPRFDESYLELMRDFADHAAIALTIARGRRDATEMIMLADRERIAHDLHDQVIQRVFAVGLDLQGVVARVSSPQLAQRLTRSIDELHAVINEIRTTVFDLQHPLDGHGAFAGRVRKAFSQLTEDRDIVATLRMSGPVSVVSARLADHAEAVVVEAVSNALRHSGAGAITVEVTVADNLTIEICDDGRGIPPDNARRSGLANLARRAEQAGGVFSVSSPPAGGARLVWIGALDD